MHIKLPVVLHDCALINVTDTVGRMLENNHYVRCLLLDFSKAFDTVDHLILLIKLHSYHLPGNILSWIVSFLTDSLTMH